MPSRAPRSARDSAPPSIQAKLVPSWDRPVAKSTLIEVLSGYHAPKSGGGIRTQRADVPVKSTVTFLTARLSIPTVVGSRKLPLAGAIPGRANLAQAREDLGSGFPACRPEQAASRERSTRARGHPRCLRANESRSTTVG
jgi:hypothetical protein